MLALVAFFILIPLWTIGLIVMAFKMKSNGEKVFGFLDDLK